MPNPTSSTNAVILKNQSPSGTPIQATFLPEKGMNLISFKWGDIEIIDQSTLPLFEERFAGLGALIGPHFHRRNPSIINKIPDESLFPHIARIKSKGTTDPFSHGIGRYAPWNATATDTSIKATLSGKDTWHDVPLSTLEGQNFKMNYQASLSPNSLDIDFNVVSDSDSLIGLHYYYHLPQGSGKIISNVQSKYIGPNGLESLPSTWNFDDRQLFTFDLSNEADYTFFPFPSPREGKIILDTGLYEVIITYTCQSTENCWQLYHPKDASFVCIEPISSQDPHHPNLTVSGLHISIACAF